MASTSSTNELIEKLGKASTQTKAAVLVVALALLGGLYWYFVYSGLADERTALAATRRNLSNEVKRLKDRQKEYVDLLQKKMEVEEELKKNAVKLPASSELPAFFTHLQAQALAANVQLLNWQREDEMPVESYVKVPVKMEVKGDFYQVTQYFKLLYETPRIITIEKLAITVSDKQNDQLVLKATFTASTFRQADAPIKQNPEWYNAYAMKNPMQRWGQASEMAGPTIFLLSDAASYVTGTILYADGGWLAADGRFTPPRM